MCSSLSTIACVGCEPLRVLHYFLRPQYVKLVARSSSYVIEVHVYCAVNTSSTTRLPFVTTNSTSSVSMKQGSKHFAFCACICWRFTCTCRGGISCWLISVTISVTLKSNPSSVVSDNSRCCRLMVRCCRRAALLSVISVMDSWLYNH